ncbi:MepB family protein [Paeniglutamicibacter sp. Y32M11]|uniref:MepB family protein n=1 Tax=Paeniglutamicibacter sp. Y32M11 TaxID=2853258 RepID=UPI001C5274DA|nr:MepB family protein [Paeniglutamicibacter sp. Y32M11]QXQ10762.1 MepB family protein [Paeniglutamicibacter sp. Y32M11]
MPQPAFSASLYPAELTRFLAASGLLAGYELSNVVLDPNPQAVAYSGCSFVLTDGTGKQNRAVFRAAKVTPTKAGLFVTLWIRGTDGQTRPYRATDGIDVLYVAAHTAGGYGYFRFTAADLLKAKILAGDASAGKRGFRLYTPWDTSLNRTAQNTWLWQQHCFTVLSS